MNRAVLQKSTISLVAALVMVGGSALAAATPDTTAAPAASPQEEEARFQAFLRDFRSEALNAGIRPEIYDRAVSGIDVNPRVEELNEKQPEFVRPIWEYLAGVITEMRIEQGRELIAANADLFARLQGGYGVPPEILTAIWGLETGYGRNEGGFNLFEALANLAFEGPRVNYARQQLIAALQIASAEGIDPRTMTSSWAGAFGHTQFVPTTFLRYAVDGDGDGRRDLWNSPADALASTANYLKQSGWRAGEPWGEEVKLPDNFPYELADGMISKPVSEWGQLGVRSVSGEPLPANPESGAIILPAGYRGPAFLVSGNFNALLKYNSATSYALGVGLLSDRLKGVRSVQASWPVDESTLDLSSGMTLQEALTALGFPAGMTDGILGARTRQAIRDYQRSRGLPVDGFATGSLLTRVLNERAALP